jgi:transcriptional regulator with XRE-family HTH domain
MRRNQSTPGQGGTPKRGEAAHLTNRPEAAQADRGSPHPVDVQVGHRLRLRRAALGLSQTKLAEQVGLTFQAIQKYERGENRTSASRLHQFAQILNVPVSYFFDEPPSKGAASVEPWLTELSEREIHELLRAYSALRNDRLRRSFLRLLRDSVRHAR